jgi:hypothetical protein
MRRLTVALLVGISCLPWSLQAATNAMLTLAWEWEGTAGQEPVWQLTRVSIASAGPQKDQVTLAPIADAQCKALAQKTYLPGQTRCAQLACPGPGAYAMTLQAQSGAVSPPSNVLQFGIGAGPSCPAIGFGEAVVAVLHPPSPTAPQMPPTLAAPAPATTAPPAPESTAPPPSMPAVPTPTAPPSRDAPPPAEASVPAPAPVDTPAPPVPAPDPAVSIADWPVLTP